jgi:hypothetical protein
LYPELNNLFFFLAAAVALVEAREVAEAEAEAEAEQEVVDLIGLLPPVASF